MKNNGSEITEKDIETTITYLKTSDPENATRENAIKFLQGMQITAHMIAHDEVDKEHLVYKSYLMGAGQITDSDLTKLKIGIMKDEGSTSRKLTIPKESIEKYKELIRQKLDAGFWNDFVGTDQIYFIFKMPDGEIIEYTYSENNRLDIAKLCTKLNGDPIEKTNNLLNYLAENPFYTEELKLYQSS